MNYVLIVSYLAALALFCFVRPSWRHIGPSLLDSFVIGLSLFAVGSVLVWREDLPHAEIVMQIGLSTALSGILGASLWSILFASRIARLNFFADAQRFFADTNVRFTITTGLVVSTLVILFLLVAISLHPHIRGLLIDAVLGVASLNEARLMVSSGTEGYFAPGYVKQFRDIIVPILCVAAILCGGSYQRRGLLYVALFVALIATFVSGQRLVMVQYTLCLGTAFLIDRFSSRPHFASWAKIAILILILIGSIGLMTKMLGRLDVALSPLLEQQKEEMRQIMLDVQARKKQNALEMLAAAEQKLRSAISQTELTSARQELERARADLALVDRTIFNVQKGNLETGEPPAELKLTNVPVAIASVIALAHRAVIAIPRENTLTYLLWRKGARFPGAGWVTDLASIRPGTQKQLSTELSRGIGDSPLGFATDIFYNWGWAGVAVIPILLALAFVWLDIAFTAASSPLTSAAKIFLFFTIPLVYSPFLFVLYGGFVAVGILFYVWLLRHGMLAFLGLRAG